MRETLDPEKLFEVFKTILKNRRISYAKLAKNSQLSEATVKRIFSKRNCSLEKFSKLALAAGINLNDIFEYAKHRENAQFSVSEDIEAFLAENFDYFIIYRQALCYQNLDELSKYTKLSTKKIYPYLRKLEELGLIHRMPLGGIADAKEGFFTLSENGPLRRAICQKWLPKMLAEVIGDCDRPEHLIELTSARASQATIDQFFEDYRALTKSFLRSASFDKTIRPNETRPIGVAILAGPYRTGLGKLGLELLKEQQE